MIGSAMFYKVNVNGATYFTNIKTKKDAMSIAVNQAKKGNNVFVFRVYPETDRKPSHKEIIYYNIPFHKGTLKGRSK